MSNTKLIFVGPVGAGKSTAIQTMARGRQLSTDEQASDMTRQRKETTTVAMDYCVLNGRSRRLHLYGTPGQERFSFMWDIITQGGHGLILLLDNSRHNPFQDMRFFLNQYKEFALSGKIVLGLTKMDLAERGPSVADYQGELGSMGLNLCVAGADVRNQADVSRLVDMLLPYVDGSTEGESESQCLVG